MAQWLRVRVAAAETHDHVPSTYVLAQPFLTSELGDSLPSARHVRKYRQSAHTRKIKLNIFLKQFYIEQ